MTKTKLRPDKFDPYCYNTLSDMIIQPAGTKKQYQLTCLRLRANKLGCQIFIYFNLTDTELLLLENLLRGVFHKDSKEKGDITTTAAVFDTVLLLLMSLMKQLLDLF